MSAHPHISSALPLAMLPIGIADVPEVEIGDARYLVRYARTPEELDDVLRLRFEVFNLELGEGLRESFETGRDEDAFDAVCRHLMVVERASGDVVGTYRMQTSAMASAGRGFYTATEYDLSFVPAHVLDDAVELGRACIAREHRNTRVLFLLWKGLAAYVAHNGKRYLFGCCSLASQDPKEAAGVAAWLRTSGHVASSPWIEPLAAYACQAVHEPPDAGGARVPPLFGIYLRHGAKVCGAPALDRAFGTIDFPVMLDVRSLSAASRATFFGVEAR